MFCNYNTKITVFCTYNDFKKIANLKKGLGIKSQKQAKDQKL